MVTPVSSTGRFHCTSQRFLCSPCLPLLGLKWLIQLGISRRCCFLNAHSVPGAAAGTLAKSNEISVTSQEDSCYLSPFCREEVTCGQAHLPVPGMHRTPTEDGSCPRGGWNGG